MDLFMFYDKYFEELKVCIQETPKRVLLQTAKDPEEMQHNAEFHQGPHCL